MSLLLFALQLTVEAQGTVITGNVIDSETGETIPFVNLSIKGTTAGATSGISGNFKIVTSLNGDSLVVSYIGYISQVVAISPGVEQEINFSLQSELIGLKEIVFEAGENPAFPIMRKVVENKKLNDKYSLKNFEYDSYTKIEFDVADMAPKFQDKKLVQRVYEAIEKEAYTGPDGSPFVPIFHSESISRLYVQSRPFLRREDISKANIHGVAIQDKKTVSQLTGVSFQEYNFYENWMNIVKKDFISPIADGWRTFYDYYLIDSAMVDGHYAYKLEFFPKNNQDLAFKGEMWITKSEYAILKIDAVVDGKANLNFIKSIRLHQELQPTEYGPWLPVKNEFEILISEIAQNFTGVRASFKIINSNWELEKDYPGKFFLSPIQLADDAIDEREEFWQGIRPVPLNKMDLKAIDAIHTISDIPQVNLIAELVKAVRRGFIRRGPIDWGPWLFTYANNDIEGHRMRIGGKTNYEFNERTSLGGFIAYGTKDKAIKYGVEVDHLISRKPWTTLHIERRYDVEQLGVVDEANRKNFIFSAAARFGTLAKPHFLTQNSISIQRDLIRGLTQKISFKNEKFQPLFPFGYLEQPNQSNDIIEEFKTSEFEFETRLSRDEQFLMENNIRHSLGTLSAPTFIFRYRLGINNLLGSQFNYHKFSLRMIKTVGMGLLGRSLYTIEGGYIPTTLPFPLLQNHIGNSTFLVHPESFNLMEFGEFVSDRYAFIRLNHYFEGFILNRIPLMRRLKWRLVASANVLYGQLSDKNRATIPVTNLNGDPLPVVRSIENIPYIEAGYGIENIIKILTVMAFHRVTYRDDAAGPKFGIRLLFTVKP
ncbi:MAG: DUF5686 family protein [Bacteroidetes bacterium]|nr:DUF5686 family protein [Bacteroidota bacterium]MDA1119755.1 DUF5686 family protein [Bacteroidota bacterium]